MVDSEDKCLCDIFCLEGSRNWCVFVSQIIFQGWNMRKNICFSYALLASTATSITTKVRNSHHLLRFFSPEISFATQIHINRVSPPNKICHIDICLHCQPHFMNILKCIIIFILEIKGWSQQFSRHFLYKNRNLGLLNAIFIF